MDNANNSLNKTTDSFSNIENEMHNRMLVRVVKRVVFFSFSLILCIFLALFFTLPCFRAGGMSLNGNVFFSKEDILLLSSIDSEEHNLFYSSSDAGENVMKAADGMILKCAFSNNGIVSSCEVKEDHPSCIYQDVVYFSNGKTLAEEEKILNESVLSTDSKDRIIKAYSSYQHLPEIHLPLNVKNDEAHAIETMSSLADFEKDSLEKIVGIQFLNRNGDSNYSNLADFLFSQNGKYYLFRNVLVDYFAFFYGNVVSLGDILANIESSISKKGLTTSNYSFAGESENYDVYTFKIIKNEKKGTLGAYPYEETENE